MDVTLDKFAQQEACENGPPNGDEIKEQAKNSETKPRAPARS